jgi:hypothetical protein
VSNLGEPAAPTPPSGGLSHFSRKPKRTAQQAADHRPGVGGSADDASSPSGGLSHFSSKAKRAAQQAADHDVSSPSGGLSHFLSLSLTPV